MRSRFSRSSPSGGGEMNLTQRASYEPHPQGPDRGRRHGRLDDRGRAVQGAQGQGRRGHADRVRRRSARSASARRRSRRSLTFNAILGIDEPRSCGPPRPASSWPSSSSTGPGRATATCTRSATFGLDIEALKFHQFWLQAHHRSPPIDDFNLSAVAAKLGKFMPARPRIPAKVLSSLKYAFHFDAGLYARLPARLSPNSAA
jgi:hypothetical protein